jgi:hypothetical protein
LREKLLLEHQEVIKSQINDLNKNLDHICEKIKKYGSANAFEIVSKERRFVQQEKRENNLL